ncbi:MAG: sugar phosphate isomerase/epimerase [Cyclobacteriaceae bacterium]|nr:sugar phosphate isomerase/epimerase [Cyclobacteriaceae bacterium]
MPDLNKLCVHTITTKPWDFATACEKYAEAGVKGITIWRDAIEGIDSEQVKGLLKKHDLTLVSYCRGGFFPAVDEKKRQEAIADNIRMVEEAAAIGAPMIVLVCGADPKQSLETSRNQIVAGIEATLKVAEKYNVKLAIEPLHPMYAGDRSAVNDLKTATEMVEKINHPLVGVAVDVYHLWWDPHLEEEIYRCGMTDKLFAFHICDWKVPTTDMLLDRGLMGEGCIDVPRIRSWVEHAGFNGFNEVEIFSNAYWEMPQEEFLEKIIEGYKNHS